MADYVEITSINESKRTFLDIETNQKVECTCPIIIIPMEIGRDSGSLFSDQPHQQIGQNCPVHKSWVD